MKKVVLALCAFVFLLFGYNAAFASTVQLIGKNVYLYYPAHYHANAHKPSFALLKEPKSIGPVKVIHSPAPHFYLKGGKSLAVLPLPAGCDLYGTGEVTGSLRRNGEEITLWNTDNYKYSLHNGKQLYQSHPWVLGVCKDGTAFGILADNTWKQQIDLSDSIRFSSDGPVFRIVVIEKSTPQEVVAELASLTGKMEMPPLWALGYQQCRYSYVPDSRIKAVADTFRLKRLPCDVIWMDIDYMERYKVFTFDKAKISDPKAVNNYLHDKGFHSIWMIDPGIKIEPGYQLFEAGTKENHWVLDSAGNVFKGRVWPGPCVFPDFTRPETRSWWSALYKDFMATGIDGVWNDMNEPSVFDGIDGSMPFNNRHRGGNDLLPDVHLRYHNVYGMLMVRASREGILNVNPEKRPFILSRSGYLGSQRYAATWTGDNAATEEHMKMSIPMTLNLGLSGQPFSGPDLGGFTLNTSAELFGQWIGFGAFFPFMRGHASHETNNKEPWAFDPDIENASRTALNRRYRLLPYLYTLFYESSKKGLPVMQPLFFADPKDLQLRKEDQAFLLGTDLLVVPKWAVHPSLPKGIWRTTSIAGENSPADKYQADVKIRGGAIIPLGPVIQNTTQFKLDSLTLLISPDRQGSAQGVLYEDAGEGFSYKKGDYLITKFTAQQAGSLVRVHVEVREGNRKVAGRKYKAIIVTDKGQVEGKWSGNNDWVVKLP